MSGSMDDHEVRIVHANEETVLTVLVYPDGKVSMLSGQPKGWIADTLLRLAETVRPGCVGASRKTVLDPRVSLDQIELIRSEVDGMINDLQSVPPVTTEHMIQTFCQSPDVSDNQHRRMLATTAAILLQRAVYG